MKHTFTLLLHNNYNHNVSSAFTSVLLQIQWMLVLLCLLQFNHIQAADTELPSATPSMTPSMTPSVVTLDDGTMVPSTSTMSPSVMLVGFDPCSDFRCSHGGTCLIRQQEDNDGLPYCECAEGYQGKHCDTASTCDLDCVNGECMVDSRKGAQYCLCSAGSGGLMCDKPKRFCVTEEGESSDFACYNGGICEYRYSSNSSIALCDCSSAQFNSTKWEGDQCELSSDNTSLTISNATIVLITAFVIVCLGGVCCCTRSIKQRCCYKSKEIPEDLHFSTRVTSVEVGDREII